MPSGTKASLGRWYYGALVLVGFAKQGKAAHHQLAAVPCG